MLLTAVLVWPESGTQAPVTTAPGDDVAIVVAVGADVPRHQTLGWASGMTAVAVTAHDLVFVDLDTAQRDSMPLPAPIEPGPEVAGRLLVLDGTTMFLAAGETIWAIDLTTGETAPLGPGRRVAPSTTPGTVWISDATRSTRASIWTEIDAAGSQLRTATFPTGAEHLDHGLGSPEWAWLPGAGVLGLDPDGTWALVSPAAPIAVGGSMMIGRQCDPDASCRYEWVDLEARRAFISWLPPRLDESGPRVFRLAPSGTRALEAFPGRDEPDPAVVYGEASARSTGCHGGWKTATWSSDATLLACAHGTTVSVTDLYHGTLAGFEMETATYGTVLVPTDSLRTP